MRDRAVRRRGRGPRPRGREAAGIEPVHLLVEGETVDEGLLGGVSTLPHPARAIGVYRRGRPPDRCPRPLSRALAARRSGERRHADPHGRRVRRGGRAVGGLRRPALAEGAACVGRRDLPRAARRLERGARAAGRARRPRRRAARRGARPRRHRVTILLGAEREGLPDELVTRCHKATIALPGAAESLNVAAAGAIALYEASRAPGWLTIDARPVRFDPAWVGRPGPGRWLQPGPRRSALAPRLRPGQGAADGWSAPD